MNKLVVGITGEIGCGKSHITSLFVETGKRGGVSVTNLDMDVIAHHLLEYNEVMKMEIISVFGTAERKELSKKVFSNTDFRRRLDDIVLPYMRRTITQKISESEGLILLNGALVIESGFFQELCACQTILVLTPADQQLKNLLKRGYTLENSLQRINAQMLSVMKYATATELSTKAGMGFVDCIYNYRGDEEFQVSNLLRNYNEKLKSNIHC